MQLERAQITDGEIIRVWLYASTQVPKYAEAKPSISNRNLVHVTRGEFKYYRVGPGNSVTQVTRKDAIAWRQRTGRKVRTRKGYPAFMFDQGFRG